MARVRSRARITRNPDRAIREIERLAEELSGPSTVKVGLPSNSGAYPDGTSTVMVGAVHEFGSPSRNVPQRSFLRSTLTEKRGQYRRMFRIMAKKIVRGQETMPRALAKMGLRASSDVKEKFTDNDWEPLKNPRRLGAQENAQPLMDTGHLRRAITYVVEE